MPRTYGKKPKQTRLSFNPAGAASPDTQGSPGRQAKLRYGHPSMPVVRLERTRLDFKKQERQKSRKQRPLSPSPDKSSETDEEEEECRPASPSDSKRKKKGKSARKQKKAIAVDEDDSELEVAPSKRTRNGNRTSKRKRPAISESESNQSEEKSDADEVVSRPRRKLRRGAASKPTIVLDDDEDKEKEDGPDLKSQKEEEKKDEDEDEDEDEPLVTPARRRRRNIVSEDPQTPRRGSDQDKLDIEEDLEDLQDSVVKETRTRGRLANSARAQRQQHLEMLRRRRAGDRSEDIPESEPEPEKPDEEEEDEDEDEEEASLDENQSPTNYQTRLNFQQENSDVESAIASNEDLDRYDDDFVLEDEENDTLGVPAGLEDMPFEFTRHAYKQTKEYFRDTVEWMIFNQLNPAFPRSAAMYQAAFTKVEDEVRGWTGSQVMSTVWNLDFYRALMARPHIEITSYPTSDNHPCDACNRSKHPASFDVKLHGKVYSMDTLEALEDDGDDESTREKDRNGNVIPFEDTRFYMGRNCKARAEMAHPAIHWRYHLNEWVVDYLDRKEYLSDEKILERSHWSQKRKATYAVETVAMMDQTDEIKKMWRDFKLHLEAARESGNERFDKF